jgi:formylglycine-generating enzyme required for sulfatase activity
MPLNPALERQQLFISYSRADREWVDRLKAMLGPLLRGGDLYLWDDSQIEPGARWQEEIARALSSAKVALLLVSPDFLNSDFIDQEELPPLLQAAEEEGLVLLWVKLRPCLVQRTPIHAYQAALDPVRPLSTMPVWEQEVALEKVAQRIEAAFQGTREPKPRSQAAPAPTPTQTPAQAPTPAPAPTPTQTPAQAPTPAPAPAPGTAAPPGLARQRLAGSDTAWGLVEELAPGVELQLVEIAAGRFSMGSPPGEEGRTVYENAAEEWKCLAGVAGVDVEAQRLVSVPRFWLGRFPITQAQWQVVAGWPQLERELDPDPAQFKGVDRPVEGVSWHDAQEFCRRLSKRTGRHYSLPSEALWEYACRAGSTTPFHFGPTISSKLANFHGNYTYASGPKSDYREHTTPVGCFPANALGLHDMHGNVWEWCLDRWHPSPRQGPSDGRPWLEPAEELPPVGRELRLLRGGSWFGEPHFCRSACRTGVHPGALDDGVGFRVCCLPPGLPSWPLNP